jgi:tetratricopeptide (TPR) repeat protein
MHRRCRLAVPFLLCYVPILATAIAQDNVWVGRKFWPKRNCKAMVGDKEVPKNLLTVPLIPEMTEGDSLWVGKGWVKKSDVVPFDQAVEYYTDYLRDNPGSNWAYECRGCVWREKGEFDNALKDFDEAIRLDPLSASSRGNRGNAWREKGDLDKALTDYTEAIRLDPEAPGSYNNRGNIWFLRGDFDRALKDYAEVLRIAPQSVALFNNVAFICAASPDAKHRDGRKAVELATKACELTSWKNHNTLDTLAAAYAETGDFEKAVEWQTKATDMAPEKEKDDHRSRIDLYKSRKPFRFGSKK